MLKCITPLQGVIAHYMHYIQKTVNPSRIISNCPSPLYVHMSPVHLPPLCLIEIFQLISLMPCPHHLTSLLHPSSSNPHYCLRLPLKKITPSLLATSDRFFSSHCLSHPPTQQPSNHSALLPTFFTERYLPSPHWQRPIMLYFAHLNTANSKQ